MQQDPILAVLTAADDERRQAELRFARLRVACDSARDARDDLERAKGYGRPAEEVQRLADAYAAAVAEVRRLRD